MGEREEGREGGRGGKGESEGGSIQERRSASMWSG